ncbi:MAG: tRNA pseudouridine(38-40) synthase TruA [Rhodospirillaceae bacterium]
MSRWKLTLEYDGRPFVGWQCQKNGSSVQQVLEDAVLRFSGCTVRVQGSGRTDAGVHALAQIAHFDLDKAFSAETVRGALNYHVRPWPVSVLAAETVPDSFHARFSATGRRYLYRIVNRRAPLALERGRVWHVMRPLDAAAMHEAARILIGRHDFSSFRASLCQAASPVKTLDRLEVSRHGEEIHIIAAARSFLHHQVRNMVGTLELVGAGKWDADKLRAALVACDRNCGGPTAPPDGLYFTAAFYE